MYSRPEQLLEKYPITVKSFSKGRECYLCDTNLGSMALREYQGSKERAAFLEAMLKHLKNNGLLVESIIQTSEGEILATDEEERKFLLCENYRGAECDTQNREDMIAAVKVLANLHNVSGTFSGEMPEMVKRKQNSLLEVCERHNREMKQVKNYIRSKKKKNVFEMLFVRQCDSFMQKAMMVTEALKNVECGPELYGFCHGDYNQHSIIFAKQGIAVVGLEHFTYDLQIRDLANFVRKMMEKNNWDVELGRTLIETYHEIYGLKEQERQYLYFYLAYPEKFWKLANHYYGSRKAWIPARYVQKLELLNAQQTQRNQFLKLLE